MLWLHVSQQHDMTVMHKRLVVDRADVTVSLVCVLVLRPPDRSRLCLAAIVTAPGVAILNSQFSR